jgi:hypothetical protein
MNASDFTPKQIEAIRIAVAEVAGLTDVHETGNEHKRVVMHRASNGRDWCITPDYPADLNAVHEVEKSLTGPQWDAYTHDLDAIGRRGDKVPWREMNPSRVIDAYLVHANATDKCIALLMTLAPDKWEAIKSNP